MHAKPSKGKPDEVTYGKDWWVPWVVHWGLKEGRAGHQVRNLMVLCPGFELLMCPLVTRYEATKNPQKSRTVREELGETTCKTLSRFIEGLMGRCVHGD